MARRNVPILKNKQSLPDLYDFRSFRGCTGCNGSCMVLLNEATVQRLLKGQMVQLFHGTVTQIRQNASQGCELARFLEQMIHPDELNIVFSIQKTDSTGRETVRLLSLFSGEPGQRHCLCSYLEIVTGPGMNT